MILKLYYFYKLIVYIGISILFLIIFSSVNGSNNNFEFQSLKYNKSFMRIGPSKKFPIKWVFVSRGLPVKIIEKFENWKKIQVPDGTVGWIRKDQLNNEQTVIFISTGKIYSKPELNSNIIASAETLSILKIEGCKKKWCKVLSSKYNIEGYTLKKNIWGAIVSETK